MTPAAAADVDGLGSPGLARFTRICLFAYLTIYCLESPIRFALYKAHVSGAILLRDALIDVPILLLFLNQILRLRLHPVFQLLFVVIAVQGSIAILNFGLGFFVPFLFGLKLIVNGVLGLMVGRTLLRPGRRLTWYLTVLLVMSLAALLAEKLGGNFPWVGLQDTINGEQITLSRDWEVADPLMRRVGGFFRLSIAAAIGVSVISLVVISNTQRLWIRALALVASLGAVTMTTQKGAILGLLVAAAPLLLPQRGRLMALRVLTVAAAFLNATVSFFTNGMDITSGAGGVASAASFAMRIKLTWPFAWHWLDDHGTFPFGTGIGGMGAPLRKIYPTAAAFPDNMFIFMYAFFGPFCVLFYLWFAYAAWRSLRIERDTAESGLALLTFFLVYGVFISILEDQIGCLYLGASMGLLLAAPSLVTGGAASFARPVAPSSLRALKLGRGRPA